MQKSCIVTFRCTESELKRLTALADELDRTRAWIAREIIFGDFFIKYHSGILGAKTNIEAQMHINQHMKRDDDDQ